MSAPTPSASALQSKVHTFLASTNTAFSSFLRIKNGHHSPAIARIMVLNDANGQILGTPYRTAEIPAQSTLQLSARDIEQGAGFIPAAGINYEIDVSGEFSGYVQHIIFNPATGQLADLSAFAQNKETA